EQDLDGGASGRIPLEHGADVTADRVEHASALPRLVLERRHAGRAVSHAAPTGITCRSFRTSGSTHSTTYSMSSAVVERPSEHRTAPIAQSTEIPIATRTCEGSTLPDVHAEPADTPMPLRSRPRTIDSDST